LLINIIYRVNQKGFRKIRNTLKHIGLALHNCFAKQNNKNLATAAAPNAKGLLQFEENFSG
jgi:hypothetical protein